MGTYGTKREGIGGITVVGAIGPHGNMRQNSRKCPNCRRFGITTQWSQHFSQAQEFLKRLNAVPFHIRVVDADSSRVPMYWAQKLAQALGASYERLDAKEVSL